MSEPEPSAPTFRDRARLANASPELVKTAKLIRRLLPGREGSTEAPGDQLPSKLRRRLERAGEEPSAMRELGLGVLQAWQAMSEAQQRRQGQADTAILFTDLVGFSSWALHAGDEAALELLAEVGAAESDAIARRGGIVVKRLGDGSMAVFSEPDQAVLAAHETQGRVGRIEVAGYTPNLRAGVHLGRPRKVGSDYLGVDVNIAARVGDAARGGEVLVSDPARELLDEGEFEFGRRRRLRAAGAPDELVVCGVRPRG